MMDTWWNVHQKIVSLYPWDFRGFKLEFFLPQPHVLPSRCPCSFQQDNAKQHSAQCTFKVTVQMLDLPLIENVWQMIKHKLQQKRSWTTE